MTDPDYIQRNAVVLVLAFFMAAFSCAMYLRTVYAIDTANEARERVAELEARLSFCEDFVDFAKPLWP